LGHLDPVGTGIELWRKKLNEKAERKYLRDGSLIGRLGIPAIHRRQARGRSAAQNMLCLPRGTRERAQLGLYAP